MAEGKSLRLSKLAREFNVGIHTIVDFLQKKGFETSSNPNTKISADAVELLEKEYKIDLNLKKESEKISLKSHRPKQEVISIDKSKKEQEEEDVEDAADLKEKEPKKETEPATEKKDSEEFKEEPAKKKSGFKVVGKVDLDSINKPKKKTEKPKEEVKAEEEPVAQEKEVKKEPEKPAAKDKEKAAEKEDKEDKEEKEQPQSEEPEVSEEPQPQKDEKGSIKVVGKINLEDINQKTRPAKKSKEEKDKERKKRRKDREVAKRPKQKETREDKKEDEVIKTGNGKLSGPTVVGKIDLPEKKKDEESSSSRRKRRKRIKDGGKVRVNENQGEKRRTKLTLNKQGSKKKKPLLKKEVDEEEVQKQIKDTLARLTSKGKSKGSRHRRDKRAAFSEKKQADFEKQAEEQKVLKVTEFVSVSELANMMDVNVTEIISSCMSLGLFVSINQRLDA